MPDSAPVLGIWVARYVVLCLALGVCLALGLGLDLSPTTTCRSTSPLARTTKPEIERSHVNRDSQKREDDLPSHVHAPSLVRGEKIVTSNLILILIDSAGTPGLQGSQKASYFFMQHPSSPPPRLFRRLGGL
ncbi:hypothetical protein BDW22DRAFT_1430603 [Trametopsis cervina]|nr:hypothetical protein BDW22DRAFT_1430603 [Trametopsis cervina]